MCVRARWAHARINMTRDDVEEVPECNLDPRASMFPSFSPFLSSFLIDMLPFRPSLRSPSSSLSQISFKIATLLTEIRIYKCKRFIIKRHDYELWNVHLEGVLSSHSSSMWQRRFYNRQRSVLAFLASGGREGSVRERIRNGEVARRGVLSIRRAPVS